MAMLTYQGNPQELICIFNIDILAFIILFLHYSLSFWIDNQCLWGNFPWYTISVDGTEETLSLISLGSNRYGSYPTNVILKLILQIDILITSCEIGLRWVPQNTGSGNGLVPSGNKPQPELALTQIYHCMASLCHNVSTHVIVVQPTQYEMNYKHVLL